MLYDNDILLLPAECRGVIFQYSPKPSIACMLPAVMRKLTVTLPGGTEVMDIKTPSLIWLQTFWRNKIEHQPRAYNYAPSQCICAQCFPIPRFFSEYRLYAAHPESGDGLRLTPFLMSNVYPEGLICWGKHAWPYQGVPDNLRQANSVFWSTPFNMDLWPLFKEHHEKGCQKKEHVCSNRRKHEKRKEDNGSALLKIISCDTQHICENKTNGIVCSFSHRCKNRERSIINKDGSLICQNTDSNGKTVRTNCKCCNGTCNCAPCLCCLKICECGIPCYCCLKKCNCGCGCRLKENFIKHLKSYNVLTTAKFDDMDRVVCGDGFIATPEHADAIFISSNPNILAQIPENKHRINNIGEPTVIGWANRYADGWSVDVDGDRFYIENSCTNVCAVGGKTLITSPLPVDNIKNLSAKTINQPTNRLKNHQNWHLDLAIKMKQIGIRPKPPILYNPNISLLTEAIALPLEVNSHLAWPEVIRSKKQ